MSNFEFESTLKDIGYSKEEIVNMANLYSSKENNEILDILLAKRNKLLDTVHRNENKINILDYLTFQIKKLGGYENGYRLYKANK